MKLSKSFDLSEFLISQEAVRRNIDNTPSPEQIECLQSLCVNILQPVRDYFNSPVIITSGYRNPVVNKLVGGSSHSQHCNGQAVDFTVAGQSLLSVAKYIRENLLYDQLIYEFDSWIHVSYSNSNRKQLLTINAGGAINGIKGI